MLNPMHNTQFLARLRCSSLQRASFIAMWLALGCTAPQRDLSELMAAGGESQGGAAGSASQLSTAAGGASSSTSAHSSGAATGGSGFQATSATGGLLGTSSYGGANPNGGMSGGGVGGASGGGAANASGGFSAGKTTSPSTGGDSGLGGAAGGSPSSITVAVGGSTLASGGTTLMASGGSSSPLVSGGTSTSGGSSNLLSTASTSTGGGTIDCGGGPTAAVCGTSCVNIATDAQNCRKCGHDCGYGSNCDAGLCAPVQLYKNADPISSLGVDDTSIVFSPAGLKACPATGCVLSPTALTTNVTGHVNPLVNGYFLSYVVIPGSGGGSRDYKLCPETGCTETNSVALFSANGHTGNTINVLGIASSAHNFYFASTLMGASRLEVCSTPGAAGCSSGLRMIFSRTPNLASITTGALVASDSALYFTAKFGTDAGAEELYSCSVSEAACDPTAMNLPYNANTFPRPLAAYGDDLYFLDKPWQNWCIEKCPRTGCPSTPSSVVCQPSSASFTEIAADETGVYWIYGTSIQMCPLSGCVGGPVEVATAEGTPEMLRLNGRSVYWVNTADNTIHRVAKPAL